MGAKAYTVIERYVDRMPIGVAVEIGSERLNHREGSTSYLAEFCHTYSIPFYSVDVEKSSYDIAQSIQYCRARHTTGEDFFQKFNNQIAFLYLDNYDWIWDYKDYSKYEWCTSLYEARGDHMTNIKSQAAHLRQMELALPLMAKKCLILLDDTYAVDQAECRTFSGKGGAVVPYLLAHGFALHEDFLSTDKYTSAVHFTRGLE